MNNFFVAQFLFTILWRKKATFGELELASKLSCQRSDVWFQDFQNSRRSTTLDNWMKRTTADEFLQLTRYLSYFCSHVDCFGRINRLLALPTLTSSAWRKPKLR